LRSNSTGGEESSERLASWDVDRPDLFDRKVAAVRRWAGDFSIPWLSGLDLWRQCSFCKDHWHLKAYKSDWNFSLVGPYLARFAQFLVKSQPNWDYLQRQLNSGDPI